MLTSELPKKYATRKLVRNPKGTVSVVFEDTQTGEEVKDISGYEILQSSGFMGLDDLGIDPVQTPSAENQSTAQEVVQNETRSFGQGDGPSSQSSRGTAAQRSQANNFGFMEKPALVSMASFVPGPIGLGAKAANVGININNAAATNAARQSIGIEDNRSFMGKLKDTVLGNNGYIADVKYDDKLGNTRVTPVSLRAEDKVGRTTLTPDEARMRNVLNDVEVATPQETKQAQADFLTDFPDAQKQSKGVLSETLGSLRSMTANLMDTILGREPTTSVAAQSVKTASQNPTPASQDTDEASTSSFGSPVSPNAGMSVAAQYGSYGGGKVGDSFGGSSQAEAARDNPGGGLY